MLSFSLIFESQKLAKKYGDRGIVIGGTAGGLAGLLTSIFGQSVLGTDIPIYTGVTLPGLAGGYIGKKIGEKIGEKKDKEESKKNKNK